MHESGRFKNLSHCGLKVREDSLNSDSDSGITDGSQSASTKNVFTVNSSSSFSCKNSPESGISGETTQPWTHPPYLTQPLQSISDITTCELTDGRQRNVEVPCTPYDMSVVEIRRQQQDHLRDSLFYFERQKKLAVRKDTQSMTAKQRPIICFPASDSISIHCAVGTPAVGGSNANNVFLNSSLSDGNHGRLHYPPHERIDSRVHVYEGANEDFRYIQRQSHFQSPRDEDRPVFVEPLGDNHMLTQYIVERNVQSINEANKREPHIYHSNDRASRNSSVHDIEDDNVFERVSFDKGYMADCHLKVSAVQDTLPSSSSIIVTDGLEYRCRPSENIASYGVCLDDKLESNREQAVAGCGKLVMTKRPTLVKRRDIVQVEPSDSVKLEERIRALTTIKEENFQPTEINFVIAPSRYQHVMNTDQPLGQKRVATPCIVNSASKQHRNVANYNLHQVRDNISGERESIIDRHDITSFCEDAVENVGTANTESTFSSRFREYDCDPNAMIALHDRGCKFLTNVSGGKGVRLCPSGELEIDYDYYTKSAFNEDNLDINTLFPDQGNASMNTKLEGSWHHKYRKKRISALDDSNKLSYDSVRCAKKPQCDKSRCLTMNINEGRISHQAVQCQAIEHNYPMDSAHNRHNIDTCVGRADSLSDVNRAISCLHLEHGDPVFQIDKICDASPCMRRLDNFCVAENDQRYCFCNSNLSTSTNSQRITDTAYNNSEHDQLLCSVSGISMNCDQLETSSEVSALPGKRHQFASSSDIYRLFQGQSKRSTSSIGFSSDRQSKPCHGFHNSFSALPSAETKTTDWSEFSEATNCLKRSGVGRCTTPFTFNHVHCNELLPHDRQREDLSTSGDGDDNGACKRAWRPPASAEGRLNDSSFTINESRKPARGSPLSVTALKGKHSLSYMVTVNTKEKLSTLV